MNASDVLAVVRERGYSIAVEPDGEHVELRPRVRDERLVAAIVANKPALIALLRRRDADEYAARPPADAHRYVVGDDAPTSTHGACIRCGWPWQTHGCPDPATFEVVPDAAVDRAELVRARAVVRDCLVAGIVARARGDK